MKSKGVGVGVGVGLRHKKPTARAVNGNRKIRIRPHSYSEKNEYYSYSEKNGYIRIRFKGIHK